ncbi:MULTISPECIES: hypothetical protein [unclassified Bradyrhizobium]|uniref:hypothetical protein n=1 Tax=unclassified Bradyrhizobium TaxID=2631580 RepID=UPI0012EB14AA|nr:MULTISPECIES: hypothetical protein [unclassified Bradyrhizobium]QIG96314.1 hypothetical protein G6P99_30545 [Bradyrhizobium sp. 6(2017)]
MTTHFETTNTTKTIQAVVAASLLLAASFTPAAAENKCTNTWSCTVTTTPPPNPQPVFSCSYTRTCK